MGWGSKEILFVTCPLRFAVRFRLMKMNFTGQNAVRDGLVGIFIFMSIALTALSVRAESFGINFMGNASATVSGSAGVVPITNWNNINNTTFNSGAIHSSDGSVSATLTLSGSGKTAGWNNGSTADGANGSLMRGYNDAGSNTGSVTNKISGLTGPSYSVIIYSQGDAARPSKSGEMLPNFTINGTRYYTATVGGAFAGFVRASQMANNTSQYPPPLASGNYLQVDYVTPVAGVITISANSDNASFRSPLNAIEILASSSAPQIQNQPAAQRLYTGGVAQFSVTAWGMAPFNYQWCKNGVGLNQGGNIYGSTTSFLTITNLTLADSGDYTVVVTNMYGSVTSMVAHLDVVVETIADTAIDAFNKAYLIQTNNLTYYASSLSNRAPDGTWTMCLDIQGEEDAYERTQSPQQRQLVNSLLTTFLIQTPPSWSWDGWNDDIGWFSLALARGYQMTGNTNFLNAAEYGYNYAFGRGWDTNFNGGGIWEQQPEYTPAGETISKEALSNDSLAQTACMLYQSTRNPVYLSQAQQIYSWVRTNIFNPTTGQVYTGILTNGVVNTGTAVYNQGTFIDLANLLYQITGNAVYYNDALKAVEFTKNNLTVNGIFSNNASWINTWAAEFARGLGHFVKDNNLWGAYYPFMLANANAAWGCRRTDYNISWNVWTQQTPTTNDMIANWAVNGVVMLQFTPPTQPGLINCTNKATGTIIGTSGSWGNQGNTIAKVFDSNLATFFDGPDASGDWAGLDFGVGVSNVIGQINFWPRAGYASRMLGGVFQGDNSPSFPNPVTLFTVLTTPPDGGVVTSQPITNRSAFRCVRYKGPANGSCNVAEIQFFKPNPPCVANIVRNGQDGQMTLSWGSGGRLLEATNLAGPWTTNATASSPFVITPTGAQKFYRILVQ